jgi:membrane protease YdiL (CAAX protease family)
MRPNPSNQTAAQSAPRPGAGAFALVLALVAVGNLLAHVVARPLYVPVNLLVAAAAVLLALGPGRCTPADLGLARAELGSGLRWGGAVAALVAAVLAAGALLPATRPWFADRRVNADATWLVLYTTAVRIPLGTVVLEETLFRGVLLGMGLRRWGPWRATVIASALFGLWHLLPASGLAANPATAGLAGSGGGGRAATIAFAVASTALVGAAWCWLRLRARSLLAPALVHLAANSLGYLAAWLVLRSHP